MLRSDYPSDLSDEQWQLISKYVPKPARRGRRPIPRRWVVDAILYVVRTGCQWRMLPRHFPHWNTVYGIYRRWIKDGTWVSMHQSLRGQLRIALGKKRHPTAAIIDSQSIRTAEGGDERGYDAGKKITGRKRHLAVDTLGLIVSVVVHGAHWQDYDGACFLLLKLQQVCPRLRILFADSAYNQTTTHASGMLASAELILETPKVHVCQAGVSWGLLHFSDSMKYKQTNAFTWLVMTDSCHWPYPDNWETNANC